MIPHYLSRIIEIKQEDGFAKLIKKSKNELLWSKLLTREHRFRYHTVKNKYENKLRYECPADPYKIIDIKASKIEYMIKTNDCGEYVIPPDKKFGIGQIVDGEWDSDENRKNVRQMPEIKYFRERYEQDKDIEKTEYYRDLVKRYERIGGEFKKEKNAKNLAKKTLKKYDNLYNKIRNEGYKKKHKEINKRPNSSRHVRDNLEVLVSIGREGDIYFFDGRHRLGIAQVLDIKIPVQVVCRHKKWQVIRDRICDDSSFKNIKTYYHPDLYDVR